MESHQPKIVVWLASWLIPPACREQVLGDLAERFTSTPGYIRAVLSIVPYLIASRIRRNWNPQLTLLEAFAAFVCYTGAAFLLPVDRNFTMQWIGLAAAVTLAGLVLADAYQPRGSTQPVTSALFAALTGVVIMVFVNAENAAVWILGAVFSALLISLGRYWMPTGSVLAPIGPGEALQRRVVAFQTRIRRRNIREFVAAAFVIAFFSSVLRRDVPLSSQLSYVLIICGALVYVSYLYRRGTARSLPASATPAILTDFYRSELVRQRDLLRGVWSWALAPMLPGLILFFASNIASHPSAWSMMLPFAAVGTGVFLLIWCANRHAARELQREIDDLG
jgi:hypothetical protein